MPAVAIRKPTDVLYDSARSSGPALRTFARIADRWGLRPSERQVVLGLPRSTFFKHSRDTDGARLSRDTLERISYILGIYKALQILLPRREAADGWIRLPNKASTFNGHAPLDLMLGGNVADLYVVRRYLDGQRGW